MSSKLDMLVENLSSKRRIWVLTGAGISKPSGIPTYRNHQGQWHVSRPIQHGEFINRADARQRYWARSMVGWENVHKAQPNAAHGAITKLQTYGLSRQIVTQNVDRLHSVAGAQDVIDLHGRLDQVVCLDCQVISKREDYQPRLVNSNPDLMHYVAAYLPDGDANIEDFDMEKVSVPPCESCGGTLMPNVVFFGGTVPKASVEYAFETLSESDAVLVVGSSLSVYSGYRFPQWAYQHGIPLYAINQGHMRGHEMFDQIVPLACETALPFVVEKLACTEFSHISKNTGK